MTAVLLTCSLLLEYGSTEGRTGSTKNCKVETLHSSSSLPHTGVMVDLHELRYTQGGNGTVSLGGILMDLSNIPPEDLGDEATSVGRFLEDRQTIGTRSRGVCPDVDYSVVSFKQRGTKEEVQVVRGQDSTIILQRQIYIGDGEPQWVVIRAISFDWEKVCDEDVEEEEEEEMPKVDGEFVSLLWKALVKAGESFAGAAALPFGDWEEPGTKCSLMLEQEEIIAEEENGNQEVVVPAEIEMARIDVKNETELGDLIHYLIGRGKRVPLTVTISGLQALAIRASTERKIRPLPTRDAIEFSLIEESKADYRVNMSRFAEGTSLIVQLGGKFAAIMEVYGMDAEGQEFVCMVGNPWTACGRSLNASGVEIGVGQVHGVSMSSMSYLSLYRAARGFSKGVKGVMEGRVRESLVNYVVLNSLKKEVELGPLVEWAMTGNPRGRGYRWGEENVVVPSGRGKGAREYYYGDDETGERAADVVEVGAKCVEVRTSAAVNELFYGGMGALFVVYAVLIVMGRMLRRAVGIDVVSTLARTQDQVVGCGGGDAGRCGKAGVKEVGIYKPAWSEGEKVLGTLADDVQTESVAKGDVVVWPGSTRVRDCNV